MAADYFAQANKKRQQSKTVSSDPKLVETNVDDQEIIALDTSIVHPDPNQPRKKRTQEQKDAVRASYVQYSGNHTPITVRLHPEIPNEYMIIVGEGRWSMCDELGFKVNAIISRKEWSNADVLAFQISENLHRDDLDLIDECNALSEYQKLTNATYEEIALTFGIGTKKADGKTTGKTKVSRKIKIAREITPKVKQLIEDGETSSINSIVYLIAIENALSDTEFESVYADVKSGRLNEKSLQKLASSTVKTGELPSQDDYRPVEAKDGQSKPLQIDSKPSNVKINTDECEHDSNLDIDDRERSEGIDSSAVEKNPAVSKKIELKSGHEVKQFDEIENFEKVSDGALIKIKGKESLILLSVADLQQLAELYADFD